MQGRHKKLFLGSLRAWRAFKNWSNLSKKNFCEGYLIRRPTYINEFKKKKTLIFKVLYLLKMCPISVGSVHNFGKSDNDIL